MSKSVVFESTEERLLNSEGEVERCSPNRAIYWPIVGVIGAFLVGLSVWLLLDHSMPRWDMTCHLMRGHECASILQAHQNVFHKIAKLVTFTSYYPPLTYYVHGALVAILGPSLFVDASLRIFWLGLCCLSLFLVGQKLFKDKIVATLSVAVFCTYPLICGASHTAMIDLPMAGMVFLSLWRLLEWKDHKTWRNSAIFGIALGLALLSKQSAALFVFAPLTVLLISYLRTSRKMALMLIVSVAIASAFLLVWLIPNYSTCKEIVSTMNGTKVPDGSVTDSCKYVYSNSFIENLLVYEDLSAKGFSLIGLVAFLASLSCLAAQRKLWIPVLGSIGALVVLTGVPWLPAVPEARFIMPVLGYAALSTACLLVWLWRSQSALAKFIVLVFCGAMVVQYTLMNFVPEQLYRSWGLLPLAKQLQLSDYSYKPFEDWGNEWVVRTVDKAANHQPSWLIVLPDKRSLQVGGLKYLARICNTQVQPTTWRIFTIDGYVFDYPPEVLKYPNYYLVMQGSKEADGFKFVDTATAKRFVDLIKILKTSRDFERIGTKSLPDGSVLVLYKRKPIEDGIEQSR